MAIASRFESLARAINNQLGDITVWVLSSTWPGGVGVGTYPHIMLALVMLVSAG